MKTIMLKSDFIAVLVRHGSLLTRINMQRCSLGVIQVSDLEKLGKVTSGFYQTSLMRPDQDVWIMPHLLRCLAADTAVQGASVDHALALAALYPERIVRGCRVLCSGSMFEDEEDALLPYLERTEDGSLRLGLRKLHAEGGLGNKNLLLAIKRSE